MEIKRKIKGLLFILSAYIQFLLVGVLLNYIPDQILPLVPIISIPLVFALSAKGLIVLFSDKKDTKTNILQQNHED